MPVKSKATAMEKMEEEQTEVVIPKTEGQVVFLTPGSSASAGKGKRRAEKTEDSLPVEVSLV